ncbi:MAG: endopeptidase La [Chloroflexota bacterium]|nr:MAG: endopeptidase La [Chloroflexota bacterium]
MHQDEVSGKVPRRRKRVPEDLPILPVVPVRDTVVFPHLLTPLAVRRSRSVKAVEEAMTHNHTVVIVAQRNPGVDEPQIQDLFQMGTEAVIGRVFRMPDGTVSFLVQGQRRVRLLDLTQQDPYLVATVLPLPDSTDAQEENVPLVRAVLALFEKCVKLSPNIPEDAYVAASNVNDPGWLADLVTSHLALALDQRQEILDTVDPMERLQLICTILAKEVDVLELQSKIHSQVQQEVDKSQREYFLREQLKAIQKELGEIDPQTREMNDLRHKVESSGMPEAAMKKAIEEVERLAVIPAASPEVSVVRTYLDWLTTLPWSAQTEDILDIKRASRVLDENHFGLQKVKERILEYLAVRKLAAAEMRSPILCFVGPPGVGKTSLGRSIAQAMGRKFVRVSLGGVRDEAEIRGHRRTYIGALPGRIIQTMRTAGSINPLFVLDEIDKLGIDFRGDPSSALLEVLDPEQNYAFSDHYLDVPYDLSKVMFVVTANILDPVPPALRDRMEVIELPGYIEEEKLRIAELFLVPKQLREHGLRAEQLAFARSALRRVIREYTREAGVRNLEREIGAICRKVARLVVEKDKAPREVSAQSLSRYLGPPKHHWGAAEERDEIGVATGVAWTETGGDLISVEVTFMEGKGNLSLTGQLGDVMKESAQAALSYTRSRADQLGVAGGFFDRTDIHIHVPAGAIPKDGPSAGITMATALISTLTRRPIRREVAMTGEITLRGRVLPIGGLKEKALAAHRAGITVFILPKKNEKDLAEVPRDVRRALRFVPVEMMDDVVEVALAEAPAPEPIKAGMGSSVWN